MMSQANMRLSAFKTVSNNVLCTSSLIKADLGDISKADASAEDILSCFGYLFFQQIPKVKACALNLNHTLFYRFSHPFALRFIVSTEFK